jgi:hypothetical protein
MARLGHKYAFEAWKDEAVGELEKLFPSGEGSMWFKAIWPQEEKLGALVLDPEHSLCDIVNAVYQIRLNRCLPSLFMIAVMLPEWPVSVPLVAETSVLTPVS